MAVEIIRNHVVLATWKVRDRVCVLGRETGGETVDRCHLAFYKPANDVAGELQLPMQPDLVEGMVQLRNALLLARRAIVAGKAYAQVVQDAAAKAGVEMEALSDQADEYNRALNAFERKHGRGTPMNEDLTR